MVKLKVYLHGKPKYTNNLNVPSILQVMVKTFETKLQQFTIYFSGLTIVSVHRLP